MLRGIHGFTARCSMTRLQNKVAIVTGAASGIGEAIARRFVADGAQVVAAAVQDARGRAIVASLGDALSYCKVAG
jgi:NAD(P)-dependent dehydrogenase (short-subunit alcohol dehydrogenase family)